MISRLKKSYLNLGTASSAVKFPNHVSSSQKLSKELGERASAAKWQKASGFASNVLPTTANAANMKPGIS